MTAGLALAILQIAAALITAAVLTPITIAHVREGRRLKRRGERLKRRAEQIKRRAEQDDR